LKKNKIILHYKGGTSVKLVPSAWNTLILGPRRHVHDKDTWGKFLHGSRYQVTEARSVASLMYKECFKGSIKSNIEPTLGQIHKYETHNAIKNDTGIPLLCNFFTSPEKVSSVVFSILESMKKQKIRFHGVPFLEVVWLFQKRVKLAPKICLFKTILTSVKNTRSLGNIFNFKESEKSLIMDSQPFSEFSLLSSKKYKSN
jgi:hypothetical protein